MDTDLNISGMEEADYLAALLLKQLRQEITGEELQYLENWKAAHPSHARVFEQISDGEQLLADLMAMKQVDMDGWWQKISAQITPVKKDHTILPPLVCLCCRSGRVANSRRCYLAILATKGVTSTCKRKVYARRCKRTTGWKEGNPCTYRTALLYNLTMRLMGNWPRKEVHR